ncbi:MAG TPA: phosphatidate cytidylyltransferase [Syntrophus sp. (in: bacteria)]|nr:phosphatidate cytidylyltransferase [Syntrophus sp. (in: bacteria)]
MNPHMKRWATGVIAVPILIGIIAYGPEEMFTLLIAFATLAGMAEYNRMVFGKGFRWEKAETLVVALFTLLAAAAGDRVLLTAVLSFAVMVILMLNLLRVDEEGLDMIRVGKVIVGIMYIPLLLSHFILIRQTSSGVYWIFFILVLAFSGDIAAYYVGSRMGKTKLLPKVSPGKTVEGTIGLVVGSIAGALLFRQLFFPLLPVPHAVIMALVGSIAGQLGDLCESVLKRTAGVKDSGAMLPGHGGILDRLDCLMFITPFVYYYRVFIIR